MGAPGKQSPHTGYVTGVQTKAVLNYHPSLWKWRKYSVTFKNGSILRISGVTSNDLLNTEANHHFFKIYPGSNATV